MSKTAPSIERRRPLSAPCASLRHISPLPNRLTAAASTAVAAIGNPRLRPSRIVSLFPNFVTSCKLPKQPDIETEAVCPPANYQVSGGTTGEDGSVSYSRFVDVRERLLVAESHIYLMNDRNKNTLELYSELDESNRVLREQLDEVRSENKSLREQIRQLREMAEAQV
ncbi:hypothetical protein ERJ75_000824600 [Trypanosoma vivax]|nr:hypothetical protein TRVL_06029 [Trypanosoma vivax]KAH8613138.1 hypothetical protein ERJ75_000824600 [Trypanosoma vivax]